MSDKPQNGSEDPNAPKTAQKPPQAAPAAARPFYLRPPVLGGVVFAIIAIVAVAFFATRQGAPVATPEAKADTANDVAKTSGWDLGREGDIVMGSPDAPVKLVEYASLTCGHCAAFKVLVFPDIKKKYIDTGLVQYTLREFPTPPASLAVAGFLLARCTGEERYYQALEALFRTQATWIKADPQESRAALAKISRQFGLNDAEFETCIGNEQEYTRIRETVQAGKEIFGIGGTPSFVINGRRADIRGATFQALDSAIRDHLPEGAKVPDYTPAEHNRAPAEGDDDDSDDGDDGDDADEGEAPDDDADDADEGEGAEGDAADDDASDDDGSDDSGKKPSGEKKSSDDDSSNDDDADDDDDDDKPGE